MKKLVGQVTVEEKTKFRSSLNVVMGLMNWQQYLLPKTRLYMRNLLTTWEKQVQNFINGGSLWDKNTNGNR